jgi:hypothetical protein
MSDIEDFLFSGTGPTLPAVKFETVGDKVRLKVQKIDTAVQYEFGTDVPKLDKAGQVLKQLVITATDTSTGEDVKLYASKYSMIFAIKAAIADAGITKVDDVIGGVLIVQRGEDAEPTTKGYNGAHQFKAKFEPGKPSATIEDLI